MRMKLNYVLRFQKIEVAQRCSVLIDMSTDSLDGKTCRLDLTVRWHVTKPIRLSTFKVETYVLTITFTFHLKTRNFPIKNVHNIVFLHFLNFFWKDVVSLE